MIDPTVPNHELDLDLAPAKDDIATQHGAAAHAVSAALDLCYRQGYKPRNDELRVLARVMCAGKVPEHMLAETISTWSARSTGEPLPAPTVGRKREHRDAAAKQKAYRARKAASGQREVKRWTKDVRTTDSAPLSSDILDLSLSRADDARAAAQADRERSIRERAAKEQAEAAIRVLRGVKIQGDPVVKKG